MQSTAEAKPPVAHSPFGHSMAASRSGGLISVEQQRAIAQVQAAMIVARSMPRDRKQALDLILQDCTDPDLAEDAEYEYSRGGSKISGPSIRLLETVARRWGNMESGIKEIARYDGYSEFEAFAWDMETNFRDSKVFQVKHWRDTKQGGYQLTDERDIYELGANMGARRKRACMEAVIPQDIVRQAAEQCQVTLKTKIEVTPELIEEMLDRFGKFGVSKEMIEKRIQRHITALTPGLAMQLKRIYNSLKDGMSQPTDWFDAIVPAEGDAKPQTGAAGLKSAVSGKGGKRAEPEKPQESGSAGSEAGSKRDPTPQEIFDSIMKSVERAERTETSQEIAMLALEDAQDAVRSLTGDLKAKAEESIKRVREARGGKLV